MCHLLYSLRAVSSTDTLISSEANTDSKCSHLLCLTQITMWIKILYKVIMLLLSFIISVCSREKHQLRGSWEHESLGKRLSRI